MIHPNYHVQRLATNPLIHNGLSGLTGAVGDNINGPSVIAAPDWLPNRLRRFSCYFAHHKGDHIRLAYADDVAGPWRVFAGGVLHLRDTACVDHIASPDVHVCEQSKQIRMYFHGIFQDRQYSFFEFFNRWPEFSAHKEALGPFYFRVFHCRNAWYAIAKTMQAPGGGVLLHSSDGMTPFELGQDILPNMRHAAVRVHAADADEIEIFYTCGEDAPERIYVATMSLHGDWRSWRPGPASEVMRPHYPYEGADLPVIPSRFGAINEPAHQLRDPAFFMLIIKIISSTPPPASSQYVPQQ